MTNDDNEMYYVGFCRSCGTGPLGLRECGGCGEVVVLCDECDSVWTDTDFEAKPQYAYSNKLPCPYCEASLSEAPSRWAAKSKIEKIAWLQSALASAEVEVKKGAALPSENDAGRPDK